MDRVNAIVISLEYGLATSLHNIIFYLRVELAAHAAHRNRSSARTPRAVFHFVCARLSQYFAIEDADNFRACNANRTCAIFTER